MTGIYDSGSGGRYAAEILHRLAPSERLLLHLDRENAPYGSKSEGELSDLVSENISRLASFGIERVLIACCTASTVYHTLPEELKKISIPIVTPTARIAERLTENGRITLIATDRTVASDLFSREIRGAEVIPIAAQPLVSIIDRGIADGSRTLMRALAEIREATRHTALKTFGDENESKETCGYRARSEDDQGAPPHHVSEGVSKWAREPLFGDPTEMATYGKGKHLSEKDEDIARDYIFSLARQVMESGADTLILGCTHFHGIQKTLGEIFKIFNKKIKTVSSAEVGAYMAYRRISGKREITGS